VTYTVVVPIIYKAQRELLNDLMESFFLAFGVIALVMMCVLRGIRAGLVAMVPNVFPAVVVFGLMGWTGIWIEIGSIMTASAAMGIAVDDTFHFLTWFRNGTGRGMPRQEALRFAFRRCAGAMFHTTLICSCGLLVFSLSSFMPIVRFSWLMAILLVAALVGDLVLLPALLASPLGRLFEPRLRSGR
jgi:predicted RND superfamily exporter protein